MYFFTGIANLFYKYIFNLAVHIFKSFIYSKISFFNCYHYFLKSNNGLLTAVDAKTGRVFWQYRYTNAPAARVKPIRTLTGALSRSADMSIDRVGVGAGAATAPRGRARTRDGGREGSGARSGGQLSSGSSIVFDYAFHEAVAGDEDALRAHERLSSRDALNLQARCDAARLEAAIGDLEPLSELPRLQSLIVGGLRVPVDANGQAGDAEDFARVNLERHGIDDDRSPVVGNGDVHRLRQLGTTFSLVDALVDVIVQKVAARLHRRVVLAARARLQPERGALAPRRAHERRQVAGERVGHRAQAVAVQPLLQLRSDAGDLG